MTLPYYVSNPTGGSGGINYSWANATIRTAQAIAIDDVGNIGYQEDMQLFYRVEESPTGVRWGRMEDSRITHKKFTAPINNNTTISNIGLGAGSLASGSATAKNALSGTNQATRCIRLGLDSGAGAGNFVSYRQAINDASNIYLVPLAGFRSRISTTLVCSANMFWSIKAFGVTAFAVSANPNAQVNVLSMGRGTEANVQIYCNDGAGLCTQFDCGASFPSVTTGEGYELEVFVPPGATEWAAQVTRINTGEAVSTSFNSNLPSNAVAGGPSWFASNNTDVGPVSADHNYFIAEYFGIG